MPRKKLTDEEKLFEDIKYLNKDNWKKVRRYVTKLRQVERMDATAFHALVDAGLASFAQGDRLEDELECSFCNKNQHQVKKLIAGPGVYICDECIGLCCEIVEDNEPTEGK